MKMFRGLILMGIAAIWTPARAAEPVNLAIGRNVAFSIPCYPASATAPSGPSITALTNDRLTTRTNDIRQDRIGAVVYNYPGLVQFGVDLGRECDIAEIAINLSGGSVKPGINFPVWVNAYASDDGVHYFRVAGYSRFNPGDREKFGVPPENEKKGFVHRLSFPKTNVRARFVGFDVYGTAFCGSDEIYVMSGAPGEKYKAAGSLPPADFNITGARMYFQKPRLLLPNNLDAPTPIGISTMPGFDQTVTATLDLPSGVRLTGGNIAGQQVKETKGKRAGWGYTRYTFAGPARSAKDWGRVYLRYDAKAGKRSALRYQLSYGDYTSPMMEVPVESFAMTAAPQPKKIMTGLVYVPVAETMEWPDSLNAYRSLGFNTLNVFSLSTKFDEPDVAATIDKFRAAGFKVINIDNSIEKMGAKENPEVCCQFADGKTGKRICPSYRGPLYKKELERLADEFARAKPDIFSPDIELWDSNGPTEAAKCTRCQADFKASGAKSFEEWRLIKGQELIHDVTGALRARASETGIKMPEFGVYAFRTGDNYHLMYPVDRLYRENYINNFEPSTYTAYYPCNIAYIGNLARENRAASTRSDVMPWLSPGDGGTFPGEMFTWGLLECYANGSRGVHFWSARMWDPETLDAFARALKIIAPVEGLIVDGELVKGVACEPEMRVSGMQKGSEAFLLVSNNYEPFSGTVKVKLPGATNAEVIDLDSGKTVAKLAGQTEFTIKFKGERARALWIKPE